MAPGRAAIVDEKLGGIFQGYCSETYLNACLVVFLNCYNMV